MCTSYSIMFYIRSTRLGRKLTMSHIQNSEPLRTTKQIKKVRNLIMCNTKEPLRNRLIFDIGINNGIRTIDILKLKVTDVLTEQSTVKQETKIIESKTGKARMLRFNPTIQQEIQDYINQRGFNSEWLFASYRNHHTHITTQAVYRMFTRIREDTPSLKGLTAHSMRRTFGYHFYKKTHDIATLMKLFNHSSQAITLRYIGVSKETIDEELKNFKL